MGNNTRWGVGLCLVAILVGAGLGLVNDQQAGLVSAPDVSPSTVLATNQAISVHVSGWVIRPGVVEVPEGAIVADAITAAGGARPGAGLEAINLAGPVSAGDQVVVPGPDGAALGGSAVAADDGLLSLNRADATPLQDLPGVGPVLAERIVAHRDANGPFQTVEDLLDVPGIGEAKLAAIRDLVTVP
jgi:competence protein ComEA